VRLEGGAVKALPGAVPGGTVHSMCRSIKTLRPPYTEDVGDDDVRAAALQYVRKVAGMRAPAAHNAEAFEAAVDAVTAATQDLLDRLVVRGQAAR
jgi:hypothetical protein